MRMTSREETRYVRNIYWGSAGADIRDVRRTLANGGKYSLSYGRRTIISTLRALRWTFPGSRAVFLDLAEKRNPHRPEFPLEIRR
ncbi:MAG TPA: hypothetical protein VN711_00630 [Candidatus Saccharimonadales bacterium]|nr:hypothetical protein [Candidatus Saccharimonadales bacterium]